MQAAADERFEREYALNYVCSRCDALKPGYEFKWYESSTCFMYRRPECRQCGNAAQRRKRAARASRRGHYTTWPNELRERVLEMYEAGSTFAAIARALNVKASTIKKAAKDGTIYVTSGPN